MFRVVKTLSLTRATEFLLIGLGAAGFLGSVFLPWYGQPALEMLRGKAVQHAAALAILSDLLVLAAGFGTLLAFLVISSGLSLRLLADHRLYNLPTPGTTNISPPVGTLLVVLAILTSFTIGGLTVSSRSFDFDETLAMSRDVLSSYSDFIHPRGMINHFSGALLARMSISLGGTSEAIARMGSSFVSVLGLGMLTWALWRWTRNSIAVISYCAFLGLNGFVLWYATSIRGYAAMMWGIAAVVIVSSIVRSFELSKTEYRFCVMTVLVGSLLGGLAHFFGFLYLVFTCFLFHVGIWTELRHHISATIVPKVRILGKSDMAERLSIMKASCLLGAVLAISVVICFLFWVRAFPWLFYYSGYEHETDFWAMLTQVNAFFLGVQRLTTGVIVNHVILLLFVLGIVATTIIAVKDKSLRLIAAVAVLPLLASLAVSLIYRPHFFGARFFAPTLPLMPFCAAALAALASRSSLGKIAFGSIWTIAVAIAFSGFFRLVSTDDDGYREALSETETILQDIGGGRGKLVLLGHSDRNAILSYYATPSKVLILNSAEELQIRRSEDITDLLVFLGDPDWDTIRTKTGIEFRVEQVPIQKSGNSSTAQSPVSVWRLL